MRLSVKALRYFLVACEQQSMVRAAEQLNVVPSAISGALDSVEQEFALKLVQRFPAKGIKPTADGLRLMQKVRHLLEEYDNLLLEGVELRTALSGSLSIGYYAPIAPAFMPAIIAPLVRDNPEVRLKFTECDNERAQTGLLNGEFDCIVFVAENVRSGIEYEALIEAPPYLLVAADHAFAGLEAVEFADLNDEALVLLDLPFTNEYYRSLLDTHAIERRMVATATTTEMVRSLVGAGVGVSILNMCPATTLSYAGDRVRAIPISSGSRPLRLVLGHQGGRQRRLLQAFMDAARDYFSGEGARQFVVNC